jgi:hypothetical protein
MAECMGIEPANNYQRRFKFCGTDGGFTPYILW